MTIKCTNCGTQIEVSEAIASQVSEDLLATERSKFNKIELELRQKNSAMEEKMQNFDLTLQRKLDEEKQRIVNKTTEQLIEQQRLKEKEKDKIIEDLKKSLEDAQRKATQGSQQLQGEVQELDLENALRLAFSSDTIQPVAKGVLGADIVQSVKSPGGVECGIILWESKRTKAWSDIWINKLKQDQITSKANIAAIVSEVLPEDIKSQIGLVNGIWVCLPQTLIILSTLLRKSLIDAGKERHVAKNRQSKADDVYDYVTSHEFVQRVEMMQETYKQMQEQIEKERRAFEKQWSEREVFLKRLITGTSGIYGNLQGIAGPALPELKALDLLN